jgi:signal transduction histidine kinase
VFEPTFSTKSQAKGMGLGLSVSRTIVINHGGRIWAEANDQGGTTFRVSLPRA